VKLGHVVVDIRLRNGCIGGSDVCTKILEGDHVESFCGVIKGSIVYVIDGRRKLVACDGGYGEVGFPCLSFGEVGGTC
jgi:hypothetical protein